MTPMPIDRRSFLLAFSGLGLAPRSVLSTRGRRDMFVTTGRDDGGEFHAVILDERGHLAANIPLPARGHDAAVHPRKRESVVFARSPGRFAVAFGRDRREPPTWFKTRDDRHFCGHGAYSPDGTLLYATENAFETGNGVISIRDATDGYRQVGEFPSHGIGPHDLACLGDGRTLVVANGGIATHPDSGDRVLNPMSMAPSLVYIDLRSGAMIECHTLDGSRADLSIRHLAVTPRGVALFGCQHKGSRRAEPPLVGRHKLGGQPEFLRAPASSHRAMRGYVASIAVDAAGTIAAASAPRGNRVTYWDVATGAYLGHTPLNDGAGIAPMSRPGQFLLTGGQGDLLSGGPAIEPLKLGSSPKTQTLDWDNHASLAWQQARMRS